MRIWWRYCNFPRVISDSVFCFYFNKVLYVRYLLLVLCFGFICVTIKVNSRQNSLGVESEMSLFRDRQHHSSLVLDFQRRWFYGMSSDGTISYCNKLNRGRKSLSRNSGLRNTKNKLSTYIVTFYLNQRQKVR